MFAGESQTLRNKRHFFISVIAIKMFYCITILIILVIQEYKLHNLQE